MLIKTVIMKEQDAAHSFEKTHPDFPQWIKTKDGLECMMWPITDEKYLYNRLSWAFDAGRNCVWDQYVNQTHELTSLRSELQQELEKVEQAVKIMRMINGLVDAHDLVQYIPQGNLDSFIQKNKAK